MNNTSPELYLYYFLKIEPFDSIGVEIKKNIDLDKVIKNHNVLKNNETKNYFNNIGEFCPISSESFIDTCYVEYEEFEHKIKILFYKVNNCELLTPSIIAGSSSKNILTSIHRTINLKNNLLQEYDKYFNAELDNIIRFMSEPRYYDLKNIYIEDLERKLINNSLMNYPLEEILNIPLFDYQKDNINWMLKLETNPIYEYISSDKLFFFPDGRIYNYTKNSFIKNEERELVKFKGGIILDNVGIGKTVQLLSLALLKTDITTLILVPDHLETHWNLQFKKHFNICLPNFIKIITYSKFISYDIDNYDRIIVDEIHELYSNPEYKQILECTFKTGCKYKWGISATPFPVPNSIFNLIKFLTEKDLYYPNLDRYNHYYQTYYKIFRKNTLENIVKEIKLPNISEHNIILEFNEQERILYDAEVQANSNCDIYFLRKCCCDIMINFGDLIPIAISLSEFNKFVLDDYKIKYIEERYKLEKYIEFYNNCINALEKIRNEKLLNINLNLNSNINLDLLKDINEKELTVNIEHYKIKINEKEVVVANRKQAYDYLNSKINEINKQCPICLGEITDGDNYDVPECGHICCSECMKFWITCNSSCTICKKNITKDKIYTITNLNQIKLKYSTKIDKLLEIISNSSNPNEKYIIYTQFDNLIQKIYEILNIQKIGCIKFENSKQIEEFKTNISKRILIISSVKNASGIDLSFVPNIIIFEPIIGDTLFLRDVEKQIIGRIYRINQIKDINVYRFIIKNTIEEYIC